MLAVSPLRSNNNERKKEICEISSSTSFPVVDDFPDFGGANLLDSIDFDELFVGINGEDDVLPDLEMDPHDILAEFSLTESLSPSVSLDHQHHEHSQITSSISAADYDKLVELEDKANSSSASDDVGSGSSTLTQGEDVVSKSTVLNPSSKEGDKGRKSSSTQSKNSSGKKKVKVDWTPELHRRFVQAVEQLGVDKAVPSRILELMGIDCLTRHNIASHLQKYRSHRKHLLAREAEAANWSQRRQLYGGTAAAAGGGKRDVNPWLAPTMGFPPPMAPAAVPHFRPLHVWGHPSVDQSLMHVWPKHLAPPPRPPTWPPTPTPTPTPPPPPPDPNSFWHSPHQRVPNPLTPGTPCFPPPLTPARFPTPPVPGIPPPPMYKVDPVAGMGVPAPATGQAVPHAPPLDFHPSTESVDAAIGDVLSKPWLPLPLGLKPPSIDSVLVELQRQGIPKIPPVCT